MPAHQFAPTHCRSAFAPSQSNVIDVSSVLPTAALRSFLHAEGILEQLSPIARRYFSPHDSAPLGSAYSLTDRASPEEQIRYNLDNRSFRFVGEAALLLCKDRDSIGIPLPGAICPQWRHLILTMQRARPDMDIRIRSCTGMNALQDDEIAIVRELHAGPSMHPDRLTNAIARFLNVGDCFTAERLGERLNDALAPSEDRRHALALGVAKNALGKPFEAEHHFIAYALAGKDWEKASAAYVRSMLYLRHHAPFMLDVTKGKRILDDALTLLDTTQDARLTSEERKFLRVFNRNGYALALYREKSYDEAIRLMEWGLRELEGGSGKHHMHRSVLLYNYCQCLRAKGSLDEAIARYDELLTIDGNHPEYHMEKANCLKESGALVPALAELDKAEALYPWIPELHALRATFLADSDPAASERHARHAWILSGRPGDLHAAAYYGSGTGRYQLTTRASFDVMHPMFDGWVSLCAEREAGSTGRQAALCVIDAGLSLVPDSSDLRDNRALLLSAS